MNYDDYRYEIRHLPAYQYDKPDAFMRWLLTPEGREWWENWRTMPIHWGWGQ